MTGNQIGDAIVFGIGIIALLVVIIGAIWGPDA